MSYNPTNWQNSPSTNTPINAANLNKMEQGIKHAYDIADDLDPRVDLVEQRLDNLIPQGTPTEGNAELIDIRVGANGITYPDAGDAVRGQYTELKSALSDSNAVFDDFSTTNQYYYPASIYVNGSINSNTGAVYPNYQYRIASKDVQTASSNIIWEDLNENFYVQVYFLSDSAGTSVVGTSGLLKKKDFPYTIPSGSFFRYFIRRATENTSEIANINVFRKAFNVKTAISLAEIDKTSKEVDQLNLVVIKHSGIVTYPQLDFEVGDIVISSGGWTYTDSNTKARTPYGEAFPVKMGDRIGVNDPTTCEIYVGLYRDDKTYNSSGDWISDNYYIVPYDGVCVIVARYKNGDYVYDVPLIASKVFYNNLNTSLSRNNNNVLSVNHRGYNTVAPENTMPAFALSKKKGFAYVETDIAITNDDVFVLLHDDTINRTARNVDGTEISSTIYISDITYEDALDYDFGIWKGQEYAGTKIPKLSDFLVFCKNVGLHPYLELKTSQRTPITQEIANELVKLVESCGMRNHVTFISFNSTYLTYVKNADEKCRLGLLASTITSTEIGWAENLKTGKNEVFLDADASNLTEAIIRDCIDSGLPLEVYTVDGLSSISLLDDYVTGVTSNYSIAGDVLELVSMNEYN